MKKNLLRPSLILLVIFLQSCFTAKIESHKQEGYNQKLQKIYLIVNGAKESKTFSDGLLSGLNTKFKEKNVLTEGFVRDPLSLDTDEDIQKRIDDFNPDGLLILKQTRISYTNNAITGGTFELTLIDGKTKKPVWKGLVDVFGSLGINGSIGTSVNNLIKKLEQDQLI